MTLTASYEELVGEAQSLRFSGWDFSFLEGRMQEGHPSWDYAVLASSLFPKSKTLLDMGTGGGELLSSMQPLPANTVATEGYVPNLKVSWERLSPLGVEVVQTYCDDNHRLPQRGSMPFRDSTFDLIINRHESFMAGEVERVLSKGGIFLTQQVDGSYHLDLNEALGVSAIRGRWSLAEAVRQVEDAGLRVDEKRECEILTTWKDIGAVVGYLRMVEWQVEGFSVVKYDQQLRRIDSHIRKHGEFTSRGRLFYLKAGKR